MIWRSWEDYTAGMFEPTADPERITAAARLLGDPDQFFEAATEMIREWPHAAIHNLAHLWTGRNAWVGQATCCYSLDATGVETRLAWGQLSNEQQRRANRVAVSVREAWEAGRNHAQAIPGL